MSQVSIFNFQSSAVRTVLADKGEVLFVGKDVCGVLGYADHNNAMKQHCKGVAKHHPLQTSGGVQELRVLTEADVLRLAVNSKLPAAESFERWVFEEVLPAIRKTGSYSLTDAVSPLQKLGIATELGDCVDRGIMSKRSALKRFDAWLIAGNPAIAPLLAQRHHREQADLRPAPIQLELAPPAPAAAPKPPRKPRATVVATKPVRSLPMVRLTCPTAAMNVGELDRFVLHEVADYVDGGQPALVAAMRARGFINQFDHPQRAANGLNVKLRGNYHWYVRKLLRACGVPFK